MYAFRVKEGCELESVVDRLLELEGKITRRRLIDGEGFDGQTVVTAFKLGTYADNFVVGRHGASYTDVVPQTIVNRTDTVKSEVAAIQSIGGLPDTVAKTQLRWPDVPVIPSPMENFITPSWYERMEMMVSVGRHISIAGPPGVGKSTAVEQLATDYAKPLINISADAGLRRRDLTGNVELVNSHTQFMVAQYVAAAVNGWWAKIDEVNAAEPDALLFLNSQLAPPHAVNFYGTAMPVHPDFRLFVTYNPGLIGTKPLPPAFKDRFFPIKLAFPVESQLRKILIANGMPDEYVDWTNAIVRFGMLAWDQHEKGRCRYQITPRRLMDTVELVLQGVGVWNALDAAVIAAVDNVAEIRVLKAVLRDLKNEVVY